MFFYISLKDLYLIFLTHHHYFLLFCSHSTSLWEHFQHWWNSWIFFDSPPRVGNNVDEHPREPRHTIGKRRASSRSSAPPAFWCKLIFPHTGCNPLSVFVGVTPYAKLQLATQSSNHEHSLFFLQIWFVCFFLNLRILSLSSNSRLLPMYYQHCSWVVLIVAIFCLFSFFYYLNHNWFTFFITQCTRTYARRTDREERRQKLKEAEAEKNKIEEERRKTEEEEASKRKAEAEEAKKNAEGE
jgi:hypothetical protein